MRCKACNRPISGSDERLGGLCSHCRSLIYKDLSDSDYDKDEVVYEQTDITENPLHSLEDVYDTSDNKNINSRKYFYDFFDNF